MSKILLVDDSPTGTHQFKAMLELMGHEIITAENGRDGVTMAIAEQPDDILMDIFMPDMNGFQATRQIAVGRENIEHHEQYSGNYHCNDGRYKGNSHCSR